MSYVIAHVLGNLTKDPETKQTKKGTSITTTSAACESGYGESKQTCFIDLAFFGKRGDAFAKYHKKGNRVSCYGPLQVREYKGKTYLSVSVDGWTFADSGGARRSQPAPQEAPPPSGDEPW